MSDFSLTTLFVVPVGNTLPSSGSTQNLTPGQFGFFRNNYTVANAGNIAAAPYFYLAQGRTNTYLEGSKRSDKIKGCATANCTSNVTDFRKVLGCPTPVNQITDINGWSVKCGDIVTVTVRAFSSYLETLYFNGLTRSVTVQAPCCDCGADPCEDTDVDALIDSIIEAFELHAPGINPDNLILTNLFAFERIGSGVNASLRITGKALTRYGQPCDVAAFPFEYDRLRFNAFVYSGPATTADFIVADACNLVATATTIQNSNYASGTADEIKQLEKNYYSYQTGLLKHLFRQNGYNQDFESWVTDGTTYDTFYIQFNDIDKTAYNWSPSVAMDSMVIIAVPRALTAGVEAVLEAALGAVTEDNGCITTTTTTTSA
jgi:hypothetical protein